MGSIKVKENVLQLKGTPGLQWTQVHPNKSTEINESHGVITAVFSIPSGHGKYSSRDAITNIDDLVDAKIFPATWNSIPRYSITAKSMPNGNIFAWAKYKVSENNDEEGGTRKEPSSFEMSYGTQDLIIYEDKDDWEKVDVEGRVIKAAVTTIKYHNGPLLVTKGSIPPLGISEGINLSNSLNNAEVDVHGIIFGSKKLLYISPEVLFRNKQWTFLNVVMYRSYEVGDPENPTKYNWEQPGISEDGESPIYKDIYNVKSWA